MGDLEKKFQDDKERIRGMMKEMNLEMSSALSYEAWLTLLKQHQDFLVLDQANLHKMFDELQSRAKYSEEKRRGSAAKTFHGLLKKAGISHEVEWDSVRPAVVDLVKDRSATKTAALFPPVTQFSSVSWFRSPHENAFVCSDVASLTEGDMVQLFDDYKRARAEEKGDDGKDDSRLRHRRSKGSRHRRSRSPSRSPSRSASPSRSKSRSRSPVAKSSKDIRDSRDSRDSRDKHSRKRRRGRDDSPNGRHRSPSKERRADQEGDVGRSTKRAKIEGSQDIEDGELVE